MQFPASPLYPSRRSAVLADNVVSTSQPLASQAGLSMLQRGGNAVDAALAAAIALTVVEPTGCGVGSDAFAIVWDGSELHGLNGSGRAPASWSENDRIPERGWGSVTVPGAVSSWVSLSERFGALPLEALFAPAIALAEQGFPVSPIISGVWSAGGAVLGGQPGFDAHFLPGGRAPQAGERFRNPDLAATLRDIAATRGDSFYRGALAARLAEAAGEHGAGLTLDDLAAHRDTWCGTISRRFDDAALHEIPPNGQGIAALMALGMLSHTAIRESGPDEPLGTHLAIEAMKLAFRDTHAFVADEAHMRDVCAADLLADDYLAARAALIDPQRARDFDSGAPTRGGTVYLAAADAQGMMVSFIQSNYMGFGSGAVVPGTGIHLQNRGAGFTLEAGHPNAPGPGKRPFHTIIPGFLMQGEQPLMAFGVMGGPMQAQGHLMMTLRTQLYGQDVQSAVDAPRWRVTEGLGVACEASMPKVTREALAAMGHRVEVDASPDAAFGFGGAQLVHRLPGGGYAAGSDPRKDGCAVGC